MGVFRDIVAYLWRLAPGNPIVVRVVAAGGKRSQHMWARLAYLGMLFATLLMAGGLFDAEGSLAELAKRSTNVFMAVSVVQIVLMSLIAPIFTAGAITQERDGNTFDILLTTPLSNAQIVLGSLLSRLFFVLTLLLSGLPIFGITMIYGGVTTVEVMQSFGLAACTGLLAGAIAIFISMLKIGTRRTIFAFFMGIVTYLMAVGALGWFSQTWVAEAPVSEALPGQRMSWVAPFHPLLALMVVTGQTPAPALADVRHHGWPWAGLLADPYGGYIRMTTLASLAMVTVSLLFVRRGVKEGERTWISWLTATFKPARTDESGQRVRQPRRVWNNPIAWREAVTRGSGASRILLRSGFIAGGLVLGFVLLTAYEQGWWGLHSNGKPDPATMRAWLTAIVWIETAVILLVVTNTAAGTLTREKESQTIEILLTTPLTNVYIVGGMLQGLVRFVLPLIAVPTGTLLIFGVADGLRRGPAVLTPEAVAFVPLLLLAFCATAAMIGLQFSLTAKTTVRAVMISTSIVLGASGVLWACGAGMSAGGAQLAATVLPFTPFPAMQMLIDPQALFSAGSPPSASQLVEVRMLRGVTSLVSVAVYAGVTYSLYVNLVKGFDMTLRKQAT